MGGRPPMRYVLTPRHNGVYQIMKHYPRGTRHLCSVHALTQNGVMLNQRLDSENRVVPDPFQIFSGISVNVAFFECPRLWDEGGDRGAEDNDNDEVLVKQCKTRLLGVFA